MYMAAILCWIGKHHCQDQGWLGFNLIYTNSLLNLNIQITIDLWSKICNDL